MIKISKPRPKKKQKTKLKKLKVFGFKIDLNSFFLIFLIGIVLFGAQAGWFSGINQSFLNLENENMLNDFLNNPNIGSECTLTLDENNICAGDFISGRIKDGIETNCYVFANSGSSWSFIYSGKTNSIGTLQKSAKVNEVGTYSIIAVCDKDASASFTDNDCITNYKQLLVKNCATDDSDNDEDGVGEDGDNFGDNENYEPYVYCNDIVIPDDVKDMGAYCKDFGSCSDETLYSCDHYWWYNEKEHKCGCTESFFCGQYCYEYLYSTGCECPPHSYQQWTTKSTFYCVPDDYDDCLNGVPVITGPFKI